MERCWTNGEFVVIWAFNPTREALAVVVNAIGTLREPGPWVYTGSEPAVLKLTDYYLICRANPNDVATVPRTELTILSGHAKSALSSQASFWCEEVEPVQELAVQDSYEPLAHSHSEPETQHFSAVTP